MPGLTLTRESATRSYVYNVLGERLCKTIEPETASTVQDYDAANNVTWRASGVALPATTSCDRASVPANKKVSFGYDTLNRLTSTTYSDASPGITRSYTPDGLPLVISSNGAVWTNTYNKRRLNERESLVYGGATYNLDRVYDANASLSSLKYPVDNLTVAYSPNALGEAQQVGAYANTITYHPNGAVASFNYGNGVYHSLAQNTRGLPQQAADAGVLNDTYTYDQNGNVASITDLQLGVTSRSMGYDALDRLTAVSDPGLWGNATYSYDGLDNLTGATLTAGATARTTVHNFPDPATNRLMSISGPAGYSFSYAYDSQGNIIQRGVQAYLFDQGNRMKSATGKATYGYDGLGHRVSVVGTDSVNRVQVYSQGGQLLYAGPSGATGSKYIYLHNHMIAEVGASATQYDHTDGLGSPVALTNASGAVFSRTRYEPYGFTANGDVPKIGFTGHVNDSDTGLVYMQQRYYDPIAGRMLSIDPVTTDANTGGSFNRYVYANNSPYKYIDPDGRQTTIVEGTYDAMGNAQNLTAPDFKVHLYAGAVGVGLVATTGVAVIAGATAEAAIVGGTVAKGASIVAKEAKVAETVAVRTTQAGDKAARITKSDGSVIDISPARVKEYVPNTHPNAPAGTLDKVKFENSLPGSKGFKREPTAAELSILKDAK